MQDSKELNTVDCRFRDSKELIAELGEHGSKLSQYRRFDGNGTLNSQVKVEICVMRSRSLGTSASNMAWQCGSSEFEHRENKQETKISKKFLTANPDGQL